MLTEAVAPLVEQLVGADDVAAPLARRFSMQRWFRAQGLAPPLAAHAALHRNASLPQLPRVKCPAPAVQASPMPAAAPACEPSAAEVMHPSAAASKPLLVLDFDRTITDWSVFSSEGRVAICFAVLWMRSSWLPLFDCRLNTPPLASSISLRFCRDAGERLCDELAPELTSLLSALEMPANFVPVTNTVREGRGRNFALRALPHSSSCSAMRSAMHALGRRPVCPPPLPSTGPVGDAPPRHLARPHRVLPARDGPRGAPRLGAHAAVGRGARRPGRDPERLQPHLHLAHPCGRPRQHLRPHHHHQPLGLAARLLRLLRRPVRLGGRRQRRRCRDGRGERCHAGAACRPAGRQGQPCLCLWLLVWLPVWPGQRRRQRRRRRQPDGQPRLGGKRRRQGPADQQPPAGGRAAGGLPALLARLPPVPRQPVQGACAAPRCARCAALIRCPDAASGSPSSHQPSSPTLPFSPALLQGRELAALRAASPPGRRVVYAGDGANDLCPALSLRPGDVLLCRAGHALEQLVAARAGEVAANVVSWSDHEELRRLVQLHAS